VLLRPDASPESRSGELAFISTVATSGTAVEVASELSIESFFPADRDGRGPEGGRARPLRRSAACAAGS
jgi:hypothetical protein